MRTLSTREMTVVSGGRSDDDVNALSLEQEIIFLVLSVIVIVADDKFLNLI